MTRHGVHSESRTGIIQASFGPFINHSADQFIIFRDSQVQPFRTSLFAAGEEFPNNSRTPKRESDPNQQFKRANILINGNSDGGDIFMRRRAAGVWCAQIGNLLIIDVAPMHWRSRWTRRTFSERLAPSKATGFMVFAGNKRLMNVMHRGSLGERLLNG